MNCAQIVETPLPAGIEDVLLIGVDQRTPQRVVFEAGDAGTIARVRTTWEGDGTVLRTSATLTGASLHPTSFATHEKILSDPQIQQFLQVALTRDVAEAMRSVPVRPRGKIETSDGKFTELVGIVVEPDETVYRAGQTGRVRVHVRLGNTQKLRPGTIKLTGRRPDGREVAIVLKPDPAASAPGNPFEQSFAGQFNAGARPGIARAQGGCSTVGGQLGWSSNPSRSSRNSFFPVSRPDVLERAHEISHPPSQPLEPARPSRAAEQIA